MLTKRRTTYLLLVINLALVLFIITRAGSVAIEPKSGLSVPMTIRVLDQPAPDMPDTLVLNDFEKANDMMNMYDQGGTYSLTLSGDHATHGHTSLLIDKNPESNIELATVHFPKHWEGYEFLQMDIYNDSKSESSLWLRLGNQYDARRFYIKSQKFAQVIVLQPGANIVTIPVDKIRKAFVKLPHRKSLHFNFPASSSQRFYLDYLRLVRHDGANK